MSENEVLTLEEAATYLRVSKPTMMRLVKRGGFAFKVGSQWRVRREKLEALAEWMPSSAPEKK